MTYNVKYASDEEPNSWPRRRPLVAEVLRQTNPDICGTQEAHYFQLREIVTDAPRRYEWVGMGRSGGSRGEFAAIAFDPSIVQPVEFDHFWLSDEPERIGSITWGHKVVRMATWVRFSDIATGAEFVYLNTHLDHESQPAREAAATLIVERCRKLPAGLPLIIGGDFNCAAGDNPAFTILTERLGLRDCWSAGGGPDVGTYGGWAAPRPGGARIDWLLSRGATVTGVGICDVHDGDRWPSDHVPVWADVRVALRR